MGTPPKPIPPSKKLSTTPGALRETAPHYQYFFDRNALSAAVMVGRSLVALTESGHVLSFDATSCALKEERVFSRAARVIGGADGTGLLVGFEDGRVVRVDASSLRAEDVVTVGGSPTWVGRSHANEPVVVFVDRGHGFWARYKKPHAYRIWHAVRGRQEVFEVPCAQSCGSPRDAYLLDSRDRLWHGSDGGEWGGALESVDLKNGKVRPVPPNQWGGDGVYGIVESSHGSVFAFGGTSHMGLARAFVARVESGSASRVYQYDGMVPNTAAQRQRWATAPEPRLPISHVRERADGTFWVHSFDHLIEADARFRSFNRVHDFSLRYTPGRPDAIGSYPAVATMLLDGDRVVLATRRDGLVEYAGGKSIRHTLPDQVPSLVVASLSTSAGMFFMQDQGGSLLTRDGHWKEVAVQPTEQEAKPLADPPSPITDPDILAARQAVDAMMRQPRGRSHPGARALIEWDDETDLLATLDGGLCLRARGADDCSPVTLPGVDGAVLAFARDGAGRLWLGGEGLWLVDHGARAVAVHPRLPFMTDAAIWDIQAVDGKLVLALAEHGVAMVDEETLVDE